jgi:hypothetical protein
MRAACRKDAWQLAFMTARSLYRISAESFAYKGCLLSSLPLAEPPASWRFGSTWEVFAPLDAKFCRCEFVVYIFLRHGHAKEVECGVFSDLALDLPFEKTRKRGRGGRQCAMSLSCVKVVVA